MTASDSEILERCVAGDMEALAALLKRCGPQVAARLRIDRTWRSVLEVEDVMQVTYLEAFLHVEQLRDSSMRTFVNWLAQIAENTLRDATRGLARDKRLHPARRVTSTAAGTLDALLPLLAATSTTASRTLARKEQIELLQRAMERLPESYEAVLKLMYMEGRSPAEAAAVMNRSVGAVHMLRARAVEELQRLLGPPSGLLPP